MIAIPSLLTMAITYMVQVRVRNPRPVASSGEQVDAAWFAAVSEAQTATSSMIIGALVMLALLAVQLLAVLTTLRQFVVTQESDLIARDQVALHQATKQGDTEGVPVGSVPAPN